MTQPGYLATNATIRDLAALALTLEDAAGRRFIFTSHEADEHGNPDDIIAMAQS